MEFFFILVVIGAVVWMILKTVLKSDNPDPSSDSAYERFTMLKQKKQEEKAAKWDNFFTVFLAGIHVKGRKKYIINNAFEGYQVRLVPEPTNKIDPNAIMAVDLHGTTIGYVAADKTHLVHPILNKDYICYISEMDEEDSYSNPGTIHLKVFLEICYNN